MPAQNIDMNRTLAWGIVGVLIGIIAAALAIYLTPLKHIALIEPAMHDVEPAIFWEEYQNNPDGYLFVDVRSSSEYQKVHASGSINIPIVDLSDQYQQLPRNKVIVLTCGNGRLAKVAYGYLEDYGFTNLMHITGGLQNWITEGLPVVRGTADSAAAASSTND